MQPTYDRCSSAHSRRTGAEESQSTYRRPVCLSSHTECMDRGEHPDFRRWVVTYGDPKPSTVLPAPRRAIVRTELYDGTTVTLELDVIARAPGYVCVRQELPGRAPWCAWVPSGRARPVA